MSLATSIQSLKRQKLFIDYALVSGCAVFIYDYFLTLHLEVKLIWFSKWTHTKVLFLLLRYATVATMVFLLYDQGLPNVSIGTCKTTFQASALFIVSIGSLADAILAVRIWVVWNVKRIISVVSAVIVIMNFTVRFHMTHIFLKSVKYTSPLYPNFRGCVIASNTNILWVNYALMIVFQSCILTLTAISASRSYQRGFNGELWKVVHRDVIMFYVYILAFTVLNLVFFLVVPLDMATMFCPMEGFVHSALTARIVLTISHVGSRRDEASELHATYLDMPVFTTLVPVVSTEECFLE